MDYEFVEWPFLIATPEAEWDEFARDFIGFMRVAYAEGSGPGIVGNPPSTPANRAAGTPR